jgi:hypothetical protein
MVLDYIRTNVFPYVVTDKQIETFYNIIDEDKQALLSESGLMLMCIFLKKMYDKNEVEYFLNALSDFLEITKDDLTIISSSFEEKLKYIFDENSNKEIIYGGGLFNKFMFLISLLYCISQTIYNVMYFEYIKVEYQFVYKDLETLSGTTSIGLKVLTNSTIHDYYDYLDGSIIEDKIVYRALDITNSLFFSDNYRNTHVFNENKIILVKYISILNYGIITHIKNPSEKFIDGFSSLAIERRKHVLNENLRKYIQNQIDSYNLKKAERNIFTNSPYGDIDEEITKFEEGLNELKKIKSKPIIDENDVNKVCKTLEFIENSIQKKIEDLKEIQENASDSRDIITYPTNSFFGDESRGFSKRPEPNIAKLFSDAFGFTTINKVIKTVKISEKYLLSQLNSIYNGYIQPYVNQYNEFKKMIDNAIITLESTIVSIRDITKQIQDITNKIQDASDNGDLKELLDKMPTTLSLCITIYNRMLKVIPGLLWYFTSIIGIFTYLANIGVQYIKNRHHEKNRPHENKLVSTFFGGKTKRRKKKNKRSKRKSRNNTKTRNKRKQTKKSGKKRK